MITVSLSVTVFGARGALKSQFENAQIGEAPRAAGRADPGFAREARWTATSEKPLVVVPECTTYYTVSIERIRFSAQYGERTRRPHAERTVPIRRHAYDAHSSRSAVGRSSSANEELLSTGSTRLAPFSARSLSMYGSRSSSSGSCQ